MASPISSSAGVKDRSEERGTRVAFAAEEAEDIGPDYPLAASFSQLTPGGSSRRVKEAVFDAYGSAC
jgi:hypothetical protein